eukprot:6178186-Pleurochrysis_carterae.AAC.1
MIEIQTVRGLGASTATGALPLAGARLGGGSRRVAQWAAAASRSEFPRACSEERERSASTHAMQCKNEKQCM